MKHLPCHSELHHTRRAPIAPVVLPSHGTGLRTVAPIYYRYAIQPLPYGSSYTTTTCPTSTTPSPHLGTNPASLPSPTLGPSFLLPPSPFVPSQPFRTSPTPLQSCPQNPSMMPNATCVLFRPDQCMSSASGPLPLHSPCPQLTPLPPFTYFKQTHLL